MRYKLSLLIVLFLFGFSQNSFGQDLPGTVKFPTALDSDCSLVPVKDGATTTLSTSIASTATAISVYSTASFPACGAIKIDNREIAFYTEKTSNKFLNVTRGREGTAALSFAAGVKVEMPVLAVQHNTLSTVTQRIQAKLGSVDSNPALDKILIGTASGQSQWLDHTLDRIKDVTITSPANGHALIYQSGVWVNQAISNTGTVTSVAATVPSVFSISGSPITTNGTLAITFAGGQTQNRVLASPDGSSGAVALRALVAADIPNLAASKITSGQLLPARGGIGVDGSAAGNGYLPIGNGSGFSLNPLTAGSGISITNSAGGISIATNISNDSMTQKVKISKGGSLIGTRQEINFIEGSNTTLTVADDSGNNRINVTVAASGTLGVAWDNITSPAGDLTVPMDTNLTTFNWGTGSGGFNLFNLTTDASANGTGYLLNVNTGSSATVKPARIANNGNGVEVTAAGVLQVTGSGVINATRFLGVTTVDATEFGYLDGVSSAIQTQITARALASRVITAGAGLTGTGDLSADRTFDVGAGTGISVAADSVAIDQSFNPTWTGAHTFNPGTTPSDVISLLITQPGSAGQRDSHSIVQRGTSYDTSGHNADWKQFVDVTSNAAASSWTLQGRVDSDGFATRLTVSDAGLVTAASFAGDGSALTALNASNIASGAVSNSLLDTDLAALGNNSSNGLWSRTGSGTGAARSVTAGSSSLTVTNGDGVNGNPTIDTAQNIQTSATPQFARLGIGAAADSTHLLKVTGGTVTADTHLIDAIQTWNAGGVTFTAFKANITDTASASGSLLMDLQVGGTSKFKVDKAGAITVTSCTGCGGGGSPGGSNTQFQINSSGSFGAAANITYESSGLRFNSQSAPGSLANGHTWYDSTQKTQAVYTAGATVYRSGVLWVSTAQKQITNTTSATTIISGTGVGTTTLPANFLVPGRVIRIKFGGVYSALNASQSLGTMTFKAGSTTLFSATFNPVGTTDNSANGEPWDGEIIFVCRSTGASGATTSQMVLRFANDTGTLAMTNWGGSSQFNSIALDTTASKALDVTWAWNAASTSNILNINYVTIEVLN